METFVVYTLVLLDTGRRVGSCGERERSFIDDECRGEGKNV